VSLKESGRCALCKRPLKTVRDIGEKE